MRTFCITLFFLLGCYAPKFNPCEVRCRSATECPSGYSCEADSFCHQSASETLCACKPLQCSEIANSCGDIDNTCGGITRCGDCTKPTTCGGGGTPNVCGDPGACIPKACAPDDCGPSTDSCGNPRTCPTCPLGKKCASGKCVACTPRCVAGELACGDDGCGQSCGTCPDARWTCHPQGVCCIRSGQQCNPQLEGCNCCPGLFCLSGFCESASGCAMAENRSFPDDELPLTDEGQQP
jgi:hypothetical protein